MSSILVNSIFGVDSLQWGYNTIFVLNLIKYLVRTIDIFTRLLFTFFFLMFVFAKMKNIWLIVSSIYSDVFIHISIIITW